MGGVGEGGEGDGTRRVDWGVVLGAEGTESWIELELDVGLEWETK